MAISHKNILLNTITTCLYTALGSHRISLDSHRKIDQLQKEERFVKTLREDISNSAESQQK